MPIRDYSQTAASNTSISSINIGEGCPPSNINDAIRQALADIRELQAGSTIASAATVNIGAANAEYLAVSGTTTITAFDTVAAGVYRVLKFDGALTLTHNGTSLILPGSASITTAAGDVAGFRSLGSGNWRCEWYQRASGSALSTAASSITGQVAVANGGTGASTLTANNVILGNGTSAVQFVAPGTNGNVLTSNGTTWTSAAAGSSTGRLVAGTTLVLDPIALNTRTTQAHGLSSTPVMFAHYLECKTAELGYVAGDRISIHASILVPSGATVVMQVRADSTNTVLEITNNSLPNISNKTASPPGSGTTITAANWLVRVVPYALS